MLCFIMHGATLLFENNFLLTHREFIMNKTAIVSYLFLFLGGSSEYSWCAQYQQMRSLLPLEKLTLESDPSSHLIIKSENGRVLWKTKDKGSQFCEPVFSEDKSKVAYVLGERSVYVYDVRKHIEEKIAESQNTIKTLTFNPQANILCYSVYRSTGPNLAILCFENGHKETFIHASTNFAPQFSGDGQHVLVCPNGSTADLINIATSKKCFKISHEGGGTICSAGFNKDYTKIISCSFAGTVIVWDAFSGKKLCSKKHGLSEMVVAKFSDDEKSICFSTSKIFPPIKSIPFGPMRILLSDMDGNAQNSTMRVSQKQTRSFRQAPY